MVLLLNAVKASLFVVVVGIIALVTAGVWVAHHSASRRDRMDGLSDLGRDLLDPLTNVALADPSTWAGLSALVAVFDVLTAAVLFSSVFVAPYFAGIALTSVVVCVLVSIGTSTPVPSSACAPPYMRLNLYVDPFTAVRVVLAFYAGISAHPAVIASAWTVVATAAIVTIAGTCATTSSVLASVWIATSLVVCMRSRVHPQGRARVSSDGEASQNEAPYP